MLHFCLYRLVTWHGHLYCTIPLNHKLNRCACRASIMDIPPVPNQPKTLNFHNAPLVRKPNEKDVFSLRGSQIERGCITMRQTTSRIAMYSWLLTETESWTVRILIWRLYSMDFLTGKMLAWPLKTRLFQVPSWFGEGSKYLCSVCLCCQMLKCNNYQEYFFQHTYKID